MVVLLTEIAVSAAVLFGIVPFVFAVVLFSH